MPADVDGKITYHKGDFAIDSDLYGIKWKKDHSEIVLDLPVGDNDLTNVDIYLWVDAQIVEAGIAKGINACTDEAYTIGLSAPILSVTNIEGLSEIPLPQDKWSSPRWHIRCERLSRKSQLEIAFAITPKVTPSNFLSQLHPGEKAKPSWAKLWVSLLSIHQFNKHSQSFGSGRHSRRSFMARRMPRVNQESLPRASFAG